LLRETLQLKALTFTTLSTPLKPGTINRLTSDQEFELRLLEALTLTEFIDKAYIRGKDLGEGRITAQGLNLGSLIALALRTSMQLTGLKPIIGLTVASLTLSTLKGVSDVQGRDLRSSIKQLLLLTLYRSSSEDCIKLVEGLEIVGSSRIIAYLEEHGVSKSRIALEGLTLGHLYEILAYVDTGFALNLKDLDLILELLRKVVEEKSVVLAISRAYIELASIRKIIDIKGVSLKSLHDFFKLDKSLKTRREELDSLLGGVYAAAVLASLEKWPWI